GRGSRWRPPPRRAARGRRAHRRRRPGCSSREDNRGETCATSFPLNVPLALLSLMGPTSETERPPAGGRAPRKLRSHRGSSRGIELAPGPSMRSARRSSAVASLMLLLLTASLAEAQEKRLPNPVVGQDAPDPGVLRVGDTYFMVTTSGDAPDAFPIRTSKDLGTWTQVGSVFPDGKKPAWAVSDFWAPEIHAVGSGYVCYYTARDATGRLCVGAATASSPTGPFTDIGHPLQRDADVGSIDPTEFEDADGTKYLYWKSDGNDVGAPCQIFVQKLSPDGLSLTGDRTSLITNDRPWEASCVEGPQVVKRGGFYYLFYSGNMYNNPGYSVGVARSTSPTGPFEKAPAPILHAGGAFTGPGHNAIVTDPAGQDYIVFHAYDANDLGGPRKTLVAPVTWANGWPSVGDGTPPSSFPAPAPDPGLAPPAKKKPAPPSEEPRSFWDDLEDWLRDAISAI